MRIPLTSFAWYTANMIGYLSGTVLHTTVNYVLVDVRGVGYKVFPTSETLRVLKLGSEVALWTHLAVREQSQELFGFPTEEELIFFEMLLDVSGIGPRSALGIIGIASVESLRQAIGSGDISYLTKVSGIGKKTAEKIVVELRDKLAEYKTTDDDQTRAHSADVLEALCALGYRESDARRALQQLDAETVGTQARITEALKILNQ